MSRGRVNLYGETVPQPLAQELHSQAGWEEWSKAVEAHEQKFAPTAPATLEEIERTKAYAATEPAALTPVPKTKAPVVAAAPLGPRFEDVLAMARHHNRVCPQQAQWTQFYELLIKHGSSAARKPVPPLTGPAWAATSMLAKRMCFRDHLEWADKNGCLAEAARFLKALPEEHWHFVES